MAADVTGVLLAGMIAALGLFIIPARRRTAKNEMREKVSEMRRQLVQSLRTQFEGEIDRSLQRINEAIGPYTRFVRAERGKLLDAEKRLEGLSDQIDQLKIRVEDL
jgi:hypothetical protein